MNSRKCDFGVVGGNHEASNYLRELHYGGWVAPNIYFMGTSGVVNFGGIRIAGLSGIYNHRHYNMGYCEKLPYNEGTKRSIYHVRAFDVFKLKQVICLTEARRNRIILLD